MKRSSVVLAAAAMMAMSVAAGTVRGSNTYTEQGSGSFGSATLPPGAQEWYLDSFGGFNTYYYDLYGRVISNAEPTTNLIDPGNLTTINMRLWTGSDADLFKIQIVNPAAFSASITSTTNILALFDENGNAIAASRNGGPITGASLPAGFYYIGESQASGNFGDPTFGVPRNSANQALFDFTTDGLKTPIAQADMKLGTDPFTAWTINNGTSLIGPSTFTSPGSAITLAGADFAVTPEPASLALLAGGMLLGIRRRRASVA